MNGIIKAMEANNIKRGRLSKLQKWILINAYKKTELHDNSGLTLLETFDYMNTKLREQERTRLKERIEDKTDFYWDFLFRSEILLDYFKRETDHGKTSLNLHYFKGKGNKEQVTLSNSLNNLRDKELIRLYKGVSVKWIGLKLTVKGIEVAKLLIINPPHLRAEG